MNISTELSTLYDEQRALRERFVKAIRSTPVIISKDYEFEVNGVQGATLASLFADKNDLIVIHNMGRGCKYCTLWADGLNGLLPHLTSRSSIVLMNGDSHDQQADIAQRRNWNFTMVRDADAVFTKDMGFASEHDGKLHRMPGFSTFFRHDDGTIERVGFDFFGPGDVYMPVFPMFEMLKNGAADFRPE